MALGAAGPPPTARSGRASIAEAHLIEPPLDLSVSRDPERWADELGAEILPTGTLRRRSGGLVDALPGYDEGAWWVQDAAAALPAMLLGKVKGRRVLDIGAAPGGKTAQLVRHGCQGDGARALAPARRVPGAQSRPAVAGRRDRRRRRAGVAAAGPFDAVLLDAPCTATGTIRRHPDVPWAKSPADVERLAEAQARLLEAAVGMLEPGGVLVYAVCSLQPEEGPQRIEAAAGSRCAGRSATRSPRPS